MSFKHELPTLCPHIGSLPVFVFVLFVLFLFIFFLCINLSLDLKYFLGNFEVIIFVSLIPDRDCDDMFVL